MYVYVFGSPFGGASFKTTLIENGSITRLDTAGTEQFSEYPSAFRTVSHPRFGKYLTKCFFLFFFTKKYSGNEVNNQNICSQ
jgi:hypothetical protein